jgi:D-alanyl-D-alanine dipeptidase
MYFANKHIPPALPLNCFRNACMATACLLLISFATGGRAGDGSGDSAVQATIGTVQTFHIEPVRPIAELEQEALQAQPPTEAGEFLEPDLVDLTTIDPVLRLDIRYATDNNFLGVPVYRQARAFLQRPAAEALVRAHQRLQARGYGLLIHDAYRPWYVTRIFWDATPEEQKIFVANPADGSRHNRGCAVDLTLYEIATGQPVEMPSGYDELTERAYPDYPGGTAQQRQLRDLLRASMEAEGFSVYPEEWWHYDYQDWRRYPILNKTFEEIEP